MSFRLLVATNMNNDPKEKFASKDEYMFLFAVVSERSSYGFTRSFSVNTIDLNIIRANILPAGVVEGNLPVDITETDKSFNWNAITKNYIQKDSLLNSLNVYNYAATIHSEKPIIPQFVGYSSYPSWPLKEDYSNWMLILYKA